MKRKSVYTIAAISAICLVFALGCTKTENQKTPEEQDTTDVPVLSTTVVTGITITTAVSGGTITSDGGAAVTARGVCWSSTNPNPKVADNKTNDGTGSGSFISHLEGLPESTHCYASAYATNSKGTAYGVTIMFTTKGSTGAVSDIDGNSYATIPIGTQVWMAENLKVVHYRNGDAIPNVTDANAWNNLSTGAYCWYNNNLTNKNIYGGLYNWYSITDSRGIAPPGWHVPTQIEWQTLVNFLGNDTQAGGQMKEAGTAHWLSPNTGATNESGFTALPGGSQSFTDLHYIGNWWSVTEYDLTSADILYIGYNGAGTSGGSSQKTCGFSVRCVRD
jgi:uncharacterized protein (TIGR02145 family)